jgi:hypothetical protein
MDALIAWAALLSGLPMPDRPLTVLRVPAAEMRQLACGGHMCRALGWTPGTADVVYLDDRLDPDADIVAASIVVHEAVHWLQASAGMYEPRTCAHAVELERQAYAAQQAFLVRYGDYRPVGIGMAHGVQCE